jgi:hypothetical protein
VQLITPEVKRANPSLFAAACKKHFYGTWKKALRAALRSEKLDEELDSSSPSAPEVAATTVPVPSEHATLSV